MKNKTKTSLLFVCMGNICRSPTVEVVARVEFARAGVDAEFASAGTEDYHIGERADPRSIRAAARHGYALEAHRARQLCRDDFDRHDAILAMDDTNLHAIERVRPSAAKAHVGLFLDYAGLGTGNVPDPYFGGADGFEDVIALAQRGVRACIARLAPTTDIAPAARR